MIVVGIDPSLTGTAVCISDGLEGHNVERFVSQAAGKSVRNRICRFGLLVASVKDFIGSSLPDVIVMEGYSHGSTGMAYDLGEFGGLLRSMLMGRTPQPIYECAPGTLRKFAIGTRKVKRKKGEQVNGKAEVMMAIRARWGVEFIDDNKADAYALWQLARMVADPKLCETNIDRECVETVIHGAKKKPKKTKV